MARLRNFRPNGGRCEEKRLYGHDVWTETPDSRACFLELYDTEFWRACGNERPGTRNCGGYYQDCNGSCESSAQKEHLQSKLVLQIHDELIIETKKEEVEIVQKILVEEMMHAADLAVPLLVDANVGDSWYDAK